MNVTSVCGGCGARMPAKADNCDLCGWSAGRGAGTSSASDANESASDTNESAPDENENVEPLPGGAGRERAAPVEGEPSSRDTDSSPESEAGMAPAGRSAVLVAVGAALLVAGLYLITAISRSAPQREAPSAQTESGVPPLTGPAATDAQDLRDQIAQADSAGRIELQRSLIGLYVREQRLDLAAGVQENIALAVDSEVEWVRSGNLYYDCMELDQGPQRVAFARKAIESYERALKLNPDNLDARTDMALAYFYDPERPMEAIQNINAVLGADSTHIQANYNRGYLLFQIGRYEEAAEQFRKVLRLIDDPEDPIYRRAESAIDVVNRRISEP